MSDLSNLGDALRRRDESGPGTPFPCGMHRGRPIGEVPESYLRWVLDTWRRAPPEVLYLVRKELVRRVPE